MLIRREQPGDVEVVRDIVAAAFARPESPERIPVEATLLDGLRADDGWLPMLSLIAESLDTEPLLADSPGTESRGTKSLGGEVVGHVVCTRGSVDGSPALGLGPLAVRPDWQRRGVGKALMHTVLGAADALGEPLVALLGEPGYYGRYGFHAASMYGINPPDPRWGTYFQVRTLSAYRPCTGTFTYAEPFNRL